MNEFKELGLSQEIVDVVGRCGYTTPTPIQTKCIPYAIEGRDILGIANTGSGKTAAFCLPIIDNYLKKKLVVMPEHVRALILTPTRELATQIENSIKDYSDFSELKSHVVFGGVAKGPQVNAIKQGLDVLVATPGRLLDLIENGHIDFSQLETFVLDEADMMLNMGFLKDVKDIIFYLVNVKQTLMFSATMPNAIERLSQKLLKDPVQIEVDSRASVRQAINQVLYRVDKKDKFSLLINLFENESFNSVLIFCKTKYGGDEIADNLKEAGIKCDAIHSNKRQDEREKALERFKEGRLRALVATDVAARGIDIDDVSHVINYNLPEDPSSYVHRIGRTGRADKQGMAISFTVQSEIGLIEKIEKTIGQSIAVDSNQPFHKEFELPKKVPGKGKPKKVIKQKNKKRK